MKAANNLLQLELHVNDFEKVKDFYGKLGFEVIWERPAYEKKGYLVMEREGHVLCFWPGTDKVYEQEYFKRFPKDTKRGYGVEIVLMVENIDEYYAKVKEFANVVEELKMQPWELKDFRIEDPFGYYLRFTEPLDIADPKNAVD